MSGCHLFELNVADPVAPIDSPELPPFEALLDEVNARAEAAPGYVWRLQDEDGNATSFTLLGDPELIVNLSVWQSVEALRAFAYTERDHKRVLRRRREWFKPMAEAHLALWWVSARHRPSLEEAEERLLRLRAAGPGPEAFTVREPFPPPGAAAAEPRAEPPGAGRLAGA